MLFRKSPIVFATFSIALALSAAPAAEPAKKKAPAGEAAKKAGLAGEAPKKKAPAAKKGFLHLVPEEALVVVSAPSLDGLESTLRTFANQIPDADTEDLSELPMLFAMALGRDSPPEGIDRKRPVGIASDFSSLWFFFPIGDEEALKAWAGEDLAAHAADGYLAVAQAGAYEPPKRSPFRSTLSGDLSASLRLGTVVARFGPMADLGLAQMREVLSQNPATKDSAFILDAEVALVRGVAGSIDQLDLALKLDGPNLEVSFRGTPAKEGLAKRLVDAVAASPVSGTGGLGALLPPGGMVEVELNLPPAILVDLVDAVPWEKVGTPGDSKKFGQALKTLLQEQVRLVDGRMAVSYSFLDFAKMSIQASTVNGIKDGPAYREFLKTAYDRPEVKELLRAVNMRDYSYKFRGDAFKLEGVPVDSFDQEFEIPAMPGLSPGDEKPSKTRIQGFSAVAGDLAIATMGEGAKEALGPILRRKLADRKFENMLSSMPASDAFVRGAVDFAAFARVLSKVASETGTQTPEIPKDAKVVITFEKAVRDGSAVGKVVFPLVPIIQLFQPAY